MLKKIIYKLKSKKFSVCVIGLGYVGLPLISSFIDAKIKVYGIDIDDKKIQLLRKGKPYIKSIKPKTLEYFKNGFAEGSKNFSRSLIRGGIHRGESS